MVKVDFPRHNTQKKQTNNKHKLLLFKDSIECGAVHRQLNLQSFLYLIKKEAIKKLKYYGESDCDLLYRHIRRQMCGVVRVW